MPNRGGNTTTWHVTIVCKHCKQPIAKWDTGRWAHVRMGQIECSMSNPDVVAEPEDLNA